GVKIAVTIGLTPTFMCVDDGSLDGQNLNSTYQTTAPTVAHFSDMGELARRLVDHAANRYGRQVIERVQVWNEFKGFFSTTLNRWRYEDITTLYNTIYTAVKGEDSSILVGGPYFPTPTGGPAPGANTTITLADNSYVDPRSLDAALYWYANAIGHDFVCL